MSLFQVKHYLKHHLSSHSLVGHGVHSPFVYRLVKEVLPDHKDSRFENIEALRKKLLKSNEIIEVTDLGAGSKVQRSPERKVSEIARHSLKNAYTCRLLFRLAAHSHSTHLLELGTSLGLTSAYLSLVKKRVTTIEGCPNIAQKARQHFAELNAENINVAVGNFDEILPDFLLKNSECQFVFVDGNHSYEATLRYYHMLRSALPDQSLVVFDDIYWSRGMYKAWQEIVNSGHPQISIDLFHLGLVYFKSDQATEHFKFKL